MTDEEARNLKVGTPVVPTEEGRKIFRQRRAGGFGGTFFGRTSTGLISVCMDGNKWPTNYHPCFWQPAPGFRTKKIRVGKLGGPGKTTPHIVCRFTSGQMDAVTAHAAASNCSLAEAVRRLVQQGLESARHLDTEQET